MSLKQKETIALEVSNNDSFSGFFFAKSVSVKNNDTEH